MSVYFIAYIKMKDESEYSKYLEKVDEVFGEYEGRYVVLDDNPEILEGEWEYDRAVMIEFENRNKLHEWYFSEEYQQILKHRLKGAVCRTIVVQGK